jgi:hypothetical protein
VVVFGRDHALRVYAEHHQWRMLALVDGKLCPLAQAPATKVDEIMETPVSAPTPLRPDADDLEDEYPNVVPFPLSARTAGVA